MKIGIVSDIHGHIEPLKRAFALFESRGVDQIICAGDLVDGGWEDEAVVDYIRTHNIISVRGNHDRMASADEVEYANIDVGDGDIVDSLNSYRMQYLNSLPTIRRFDWDRKNILLAHGAPWSDTEHVFPNSPVGTLSRIFSESNADIVILGHTHIPMRIKYNAKWIINAGALCGNREDLRRTCGILELLHAKFEIFDVDTSQSLELETKIMNSNSR